MSTVRLLASRGRSPDVLARTGGLVQSVETQLESCNPALKTPSPYHSAKDDDRKEEELESSRGWREGKTPGRSGIHGWGLSESHMSAAKTQPRASQKRSAEGCKSAASSEMKKVNIFAILYSIAKYAPVLSTDIYADSSLAFRHLRQQVRYLDDAWDDDQKLVHAQ